MCLSVWREVELTCRQARVSPQGMSHDPGNTDEDTLENPKKKKLTTEYFTENTHTHTHTKEKPPKLFLCSRSVSAAIIGLSVLLTGNRGMLQLRQKNMKSVNYVAGGNAALVERHPLTSAESHFSTSSSLLYIWWQIFLPPKRLCEGYQGCLLNNHHVWKHHYETLTLCTALIKWLWLGRLNVRFGLIPEEGRKAEVLMDFGSSL